MTDAPSLLSVGGRGNFPRFSAAGFRVAWGQIPRLAHLPPKVSFPRPTDWCLACEPGPSNRSSPTRGLVSPPHWLARGVVARSLGSGHTSSHLNPTGPSRQSTGLQTRSCQDAPPATSPPPALASHHPIAKEPLPPPSFRGVAPFVKRSDRAGPPRFDISQILCF